MKHILQILALLITLWLAGGFIKSNVEMGLTGIPGSLTSPSPNLFSPPPPITAPPVTPPAPTTPPTPEKATSPAPTIPPASEKSLLEKVQEAAEEIQAAKTSQYSGDIRLEATNKSTDPSEEILTITNTSSEPITITNWLLKSSITSNHTGIPYASNILYTNRASQQNAVTLQPRQKALIISSRSPVSSSFRENKCLGYIQRDTIPKLPSSCPTPKDNLPPQETYQNKNGFNDHCLDFLESIPECETPQLSKREKRDLTDSCVGYIYQTFSYNGCVDKHKADDDFFGSTWRIYLNSGHDLWKEVREQITLTDSAGKIVTEIEYGY